MTGRQRQDAGVVEHDVTCTHRRIVPRLIDHLAGVMLTTAAAVNTTSMRSFGLS